MIQTGDPLGDGTGGESIWGDDDDDEFHRDLKHDRYVLSAPFSHNSRCPFALHTSPSRLPVHTQCPWRIQANQTATVPSGLLLPLRLPGWTASTPSLAGQLLGLKSSIPSRTLRLTRLISRLRISKSSILM